MENLEGGFGKFDDPPELSVLCGLEHRLFRNELHDFGEFVEVDFRDGAQLSPERRMTFGQTQYGLEVLGKPPPLGKDFTGDAAREFGADGG